MYIDIISRKYDILYRTYDTYLANLVFSTPRVLTNEFTADTNSFS